MRNILTLGLLLIAGTALGRPAGTVLPVAPSVAPGRVAPAPPGVFAEARDHYLQGDMAAVIALLSPELAHPKKPLPRDRTPAHMMLGMAHRAMGNWNLASTEFYRIRSTAHPLKRWAAWYEAEADRNRGRPSSAIAECTEIRTAWPTSHEAKECLLLMGDAWGDSGKRVQAAALFDQWLAGHAGSPRIEEIKLRKALAIARASPAHGIPQLKKLVLDHSYHSSANAAQAALDALGEDGHKVRIPNDTRSQMRRLASAQKCGRLDAAWEMFLALKDNPESQRWAAANEERIAKRTRQWAHYASLLKARYVKKPSGALAWQTFKAYRRAGQWDKAATLGREALAEFGRKGRWSSAQDDLAWVEIHLGDYESAHKRWKTLAKGRGKFARHAAFYSAYCAYHAGKLDEARKGFDTVVKSTAVWRAPGYYWRAKVRAAQGDSAGAEADRQQAIKVDGDGWYTALISGAAETPVAISHDGRWHGQPQPVLPSWSAPTAQPGTSALAWHTDELEGPPRTPWVEAIPDKALSLPAPAKADAPMLVSVSGRVQDGYVPSKLFQPESAASDFKRFGSANATVWPELPAAHDLAMAGMVAEAGVIVGRAYEEWKKPSKFGASAERTARIRSIKVPISTWRQYFALTRDHFHAAVASFGLGRKIADPKDSKDAYRLAYPVVEGPALWDLGETYNVDPLLMLGLMRQESTYRTTIKSHAGAIGLVQVMPATGARLAYLMGDPHYSPGALERPEINIRYGMYYMSQLINRFDGVYPMAVASYNGGPHNVSRWVRNHLGTIEIDAWVEQVEWRETRNYVKKVVGHYIRYIELYGEEGAVLTLPNRPLGDDPSVVNF